MQLPCGIWNTGSPALCGIVNAIHAMTSLHRYVHVRIEVSLHPSLSPPGTGVCLAPPWRAA
jgi:hypothetical protein